MTFPTGHPIRPAAHDPGSQNVHCNLRHTLISTQDSYHSTPKSTEDILHIILKTRKSWKTLKGQAEAVWPPFLEATMLKALQEYVPEDSRETRILGRFPMRNRFISDYIYRATGKYRSAKQVGSRLQQLRDTAEGRELIDSLTRCYHAPSRPQSAADHICSNNAQDSICQPSSPLFAGDPFPFSISTDISASDSCSSSSPSSESLSLISVASLEDNYDYTSPIMSHSPSASEHSQAADARTPVYIDILPDYSRSRWPPSSSTSSSTTSSAAAIVGVNTQYASGSARCMRDIDPFVTFVSPNPVTGKSRYIVVLDGAPVHSETTQLEYVGPYFTSTSTSSPPASMPSRHGGPALYNTALVPRYWDILCRSPDPTLYTIIQDVYRTLDGSAPGSQTSRSRPAKIFSAIYHFRYATNVSAGGGYPTYSTPQAVSGPGYSPNAMSYPLSASSSTTPSSTVALQHGLGNINNGQPISTSSSAVPGSSSSRYDTYSQTHAGYPNPNQYMQGYGATRSQGHGQGGHTGYGTYSPMTTSTSSPSSAYHMSPSSYSTISMTDTVTSDPSMPFRAEDFLRFDEVDSPVQGSSASGGGSSSTNLGTSASSVTGSSGSAAQAPSSHYPSSYYPM